MIIDTAIGAYQEMKDGFVIELFDEQGELAGYADTHTRPGFPTAVELPDDASFYTDRNVARGDLPECLATGFEPVLRKAVQAIQLDK